MKRNVGLLDAYIRLTFGLFLLGLGIARLVRRPNRAFPRFLLLAGAMRIAEGITRFCPLFLALGVDSRGLRLERKKGGGLQEAVAPPAVPLRQECNGTGKGDPLHEDLF